MPWKTMTMRERKHMSAGQRSWLDCGGLFRARRPRLFAMLAASLLTACTARAQAPHPAAPPSPAPNSVPEIRQGVQSAPRPENPGQQHLPDWYRSHQGQSAQQQIDALRREPGFHNLPADQQQRLIDRLQALDAMTPEERQRRMARNEAFEKLSPERKQEVRGAAQALNQMPKDRQQVVRRAFQQLRRMPTAQRQQLLNSPVYGGQFTPQERTVLGNLLSVEPYQVPRTIPQPYFGRP
ncbi:DUF3106 domain-containing protein [Silvibacterium sp.]|uniref:DUF3106 domain-containing protein n=1 Tax=Silvibacterium sp. TaxID=1964179 RepID=UPI0039E2A9E2